MNNYIVRIGFNPEFAYQLFCRNIVVARQVIEELGTYVREKLVKNYSTFAVFKATDKSGEACVDHVKEVFGYLYPYNANAIDIMLIEDDGSSICKHIADIYGNVCGLKGYVKLCDTLAKSVMMVKGRAAMSVYRSMNYLVSIDPGFGFSTITQNFLEFIQKLELLDKKQTEKLEFKVGDKDADDYLSSATIVKILKEKACDNVALVAIDFTYYLDVNNHDDMRNLLKNLYELEQKFIFMFKVPYLSSKEYKKISSAVADIMDIRDVVIEPLSQLELIEYSYYRSWQHGYQINAETANVFANLITKEKTDARFYGLKTADKVINQMIWQKISKDINKKYSQKEINDKAILVDDVNDLVRQDDKLELGGFEQLRQLVGMDHIADRLEEIVSQVTLAMQNDNVERPCIHMRFVGAPGTGKTTVARIVGKIFKEKGILSKGGFFEYEARSLVGQYIGQTAPKTKSICRDAYGSVLFLDEAYSLSAGNSESDFGKEAISALITEMENHRDDMVIIMAGYVDEMEKLMEINPGLKSRMPYIIEFKNYSREQLAKLFMSMASKSFETEEGLYEIVLEYMQNLSEDFLNSKEFANARYVRNLYERTWSKSAQRASSQGLTKVMVTKNDFMNAVENF